jgi:hypothetical protein
VLAYSRTSPEESLAIVLDFDGTNRHYIPGGEQIFASPRAEVRIYALPPT